MKFKKINQVTFHISYSCLNRCIFCSERFQLEKFKGEFMEEEIIEAKLKKFKQFGAEKVLFTGGEPTLHPSFCKILKFAKRLKYKIGVSTNGGLFESKNFCQSTFPFLDEICFSLHGPNSKIHNFHTQNENSFQRIKKALYWLENLSHSIFGIANIVVTRYNFLSLEKIINFVSQFKTLKQILISLMAPEGKGLENFERLAIPFSLIKEKIPQLVFLSEKKKLKIRFFGIPLCVLGEYWMFSNDLYWSPRVTLEKWEKKGKKYLKTTFSFTPARKRKKIKQCKICKMEKLCGGAFEKYIAAFGEKEILPIL